MSKQKTDKGIYEYPSSPSLVLHLGELDDKPKEYFERTKQEVTHKMSWQSGYINIKCKMWTQVMMKKKQIRNTKNLKGNKVKFLLFVKRKYEKSENKITYL